MKIRNFDKRWLIAVLIVTVITALFSIKSRPIDARVSDSQKKETKAGRPAPRPTVKGEIGGNQPNKTKGGQAGVDAKKSLETNLNKILNSEISLQEKINQCNDLISRNASDMSFEDVMECVEASAGNGSARSVLITRFFAVSNYNLNDLLSKTTALNGNDLLNAQFGIYENLSGKPDFANNLVTFLTFDKTSVDYRMLRHTVEQEMRGRSPEEVKERFSNLMRVSDSLPTDKKNDFLVNVWKGSINSVPFEVWGSISKYKTDPNQPENKDLMATKMLAVNTMLAVSPQKSLDLLLLSSKEQSDMFRHGMEYLLNSQPKSFESWYEKNQGHFNSEQLNLYKSAAISSELKKNNLDKAKALLGDIAEPDMRSKVADQILNAEKRQISEQAAKEPQVALESIVSPQSDKSPELIEVAFSAWIKSDPAKAEKWYQGNWNSMAKPKQQYVAAAYANFALEQKDPATASQWLGFIQDTKTVEKIQKRIAELDEYNKQQ